jgi:hypothetical protein
LFTSSIATGYASLSEWPFLREEYSSDGTRASPGPSLLPLPFHVIEDRPVEIAAPLLALLEVLGANVRAESIEERAFSRQIGEGSFCDDRTTYRQGRLDQERRELGSTWRSRIIVLPVPVDLAGST